MLITATSSTSFPSGEHRWQLDGVYQYSIDSIDGQHNHHLHVI